MLRLTALLLVSALSLATSVVAAPIASPTVDPQAMALLQQVQQTMLGLHSYQAECDTTLSYPAKNGKAAREQREVSTLVAVKPNLMRYDQQTLKQDAKTGTWTPDAKDPGIIFTCDGKTDWKQFGGNYRTDKETRPEYLHTILEPWTGFYHPGDSTFSALGDYRKNGQLLEMERTGREMVGGKSCQVISDHVKTAYNGEAMEWWETWYVGDDGLTYRHVERLEFDGKPGYTRDSVIRHIQINGPILAKVFTYTPPAGVQLETPQKETPLLATGTNAPDFSAMDQGGKVVKLSDFQGKVVVLDFWASWCPPCRASMPHNQEVVKKLQAEGLPVVLLAVDNSEARDAFTGWVGQNNVALSALTFVHILPAEDVAGKLYQVTGIPTQYVLDKAGVIRASFVGYGGPTGDLEAAIRTAVKQP